MQLDFQVASAGDVAQLSHRPPRFANALPTVAASIPEYPYPWGSSVMNQGVGGTGNNNNNLFGGSHEAAAMLAHGLNLEVSLHVYAAVFGKVFPGGFPG